MTSFPLNRLCFTFFYLMLFGQGDKPANHHNPDADPDEIDEGIVVHLEGNQFPDFTKEGTSSGRGPKAI